MNPAKVQKGQIHTPLANKEKPLVMHIDLNSCFAIIEQQANRLLRGRPVAVSAYGTDRGMVLASSYEAKALGVKLGVNNKEARRLAPTIVVLPPDPAKYREAHRRFKQLLLEFTPDVTPKSIDEFVLDFSGSRLIDHSLSFQAHCKQMQEIGHAIKASVKEQLGEWVTVNVGIGTNRFLAKYAAGFGKPNGMTVLHHENIEKYYTSDPHKHRPMELIDLPGINTRYAARLRACGVNNPLEFYRSNQDLLKKVIFKSVVGYYWWARLRGYEVDNRTFSTKSIGHQYAIAKKTNDKKELERLLMKLCEKVGRRLRKKNFCARGIHLYIGLEAYREDMGRPSMDTGTTGFDNIHRLRSWHEGHRLNHRLYATSDVFEAARNLLGKADIPTKAKLLAVTVYDLESWDPEQVSIFDVAQLPTNGKTTPVHTEYRSQEATKRLSDAMDSINNRYGEFVVTPGTMMDMGGEILDRIAFASKPDDL